MTFENGIFESDQLLPEGQEPEIVALQADPYPDRRRLQVVFRLSPFSAPPGATLQVLNADQQELASTDLVSLFHLENEVTLHLPAESNLPGEYQVVLTLLRLEDESGDAAAEANPRLKQTPLTTRSCSFHLP